MTKTIMLFVSMFILMASNSFAISLQDLQVRDLDKKANSARRVISDESFFNIEYVGASTECLVGITSSAFQTSTPYGTTDLDVDTTATAYDTLGELCDYINSDADYNCTLTDGYRSDDTTLLGPVTAVSGSYDAAVAGGYNILVSTGGNSKTDPYILSLGITPETGRRVVLKYCIGNINVIDSLNVYGKLAKFEGANDGVTRNDTTNVYSVITADDTDKTIGSIYGLDWIGFAKDAHVVIRSKDADSTQAAANFIECVWEEK